MTSLSVTVCILLLYLIKYVTGNCTLILNDDFGHPSPVYIKNETYLAPNTPTGAIMISSSEMLRVGCTGNRNYVILGTNKTGINVMDVQCVNHKTFRAGGWLGEFKDIKCSSPASVEAEETTTYCAGRHRLYRVGYQIRNKFYTLYQACFDQGLQSTLYVQHELMPYSHFMQNSVTRPQFLEGKLFNNIPMSKVYTIDNQRARFNAILGSNMDQLYITKNQFLARGHLAARADFVLRAPQKASFHYINVNPQWMRGNGGDWAALEEALRRRVSRGGSSVNVITGTHGVSTLPDKFGHSRELYLHVDKNNNEVVPVPLYYYKLVYDPRNKTAVAFVSINSSYYNNTTIDKLTFCNDICQSDSNLAWLSWRPNDGTHSFCCNYLEFVRTVHYLPRLNVRGLFY
ncbi:uncharacterized protein [Battus philenor]|uniref:uncharacterized protein n=1 Tax=Battus philenor TaxID=42288 RepID=UPI0035CF8AFC